MEVKNKIQNEKKSLFVFQRGRNQRNATFKLRAQRSCDEIRRHQGENVFLKRGQERSKSENQARKKHKDKEEQ